MLVAKCYLTKSLLKIFGEDIGSVISPSNVVFFFVFFLPYLKQLIIFEWGVPLSNNLNEHFTRICSKKFDNVTWALVRSPIRIYIR